MVRITPTPLRFGASERFAELIRVLRLSSYTEEAICSRTGCPSIHRFRPVWRGRPAEALSGALDVCVRLFLDNEPVAASVVEVLCPEESLAVWQDLGLVQRSGADVTATVSLYPVRGLYIASDKVAVEDRSKPDSAPSDFVYPAISGNTGRFLDSLPASSCRKLLDIGTGSGAGAIASARYSEQTWGVDLTERAVHFAEWNVRLNSAANVTMLCGDMYAPVRGMQFDRIIAHPPYVAAEKDEVVYRDAGEDGEQVLRRIIEGLPDHLEPGGECYIVSQATDREGETFEQRIRKWLGTPEAEFDLFLVGIADEQNASGRPDRETLRAQARLNWRLQELYWKWNVTSLFYGAIVLRRRAYGRTPLTVRAVRAREAGHQAIEQLIRWHERTLEPGFLESVLDLRPRRADSLEVHVTMRSVDSELTPVAYRLQTRTPLVVDAECEPDVAMILAKCSGKQTTRELWQEMTEEESLSETLPQERFASLISYLLSAGVLESADISQERS